MRNSSSAHVPTARTALGVLGYLVVSTIVLYPVLASPVIADDLFNPFGQFDEAGGGLPAALGFAWDGATGGSSFRILGNPVGAAYNWFWLEAAARLGLSITTFFAVTKFVVFVLTAAAIGWTWVQLQRFAQRSVIELRDAILWVSLVLFSTVQVHAVWSNDPVANYPLAGYAAAALGFLVIGAAARFAASREPRAAVVASATAIVSVSYYEMNVGAVLAASLILAAAVVADRRRSSRWDLRFLVGAVSIPALPAALVLAGRFVTADQAASYAGTTVRLDGAPVTFARGLVTSLPGTAWPRSIDALGGQVGLVFFVFGTTLLVIAAVRWWWSGTIGAGGSAARSEDAARLEPESSDTPVDAPSPWPGVVVVLAVATYAAFAVALQSITVKVQDEAPGVGYVYTWYAMSSSAVALGIAVLGRRCVRTLRGGRNATARLLVVAAAVSVLFVQNTVNWRLTQQLTTSYSANRRVLDAYDDDVPVVVRCAALVQWTSARWPQYYRDGIVDGLQESFEHFFDEPFCPYVAGDG